MRKRLTKRAQAKKADLTDPNQLGREDRKNPPVEKYETHKFVENHPLPDLDTQWKKDKRNEVGLPAPITAAKRQAAIRKARKERERIKAEVSKKAEACLKIAELFLPGADEKIAEDQAVELMDLPTSSIINLLKRKYELLETKEAEETKEAGAIEGPGKPDGTGPYGGTEECQKSKTSEEDDEDEDEDEDKEASEEEIEINASDDSAILDQIFETPSKTAAKKGAKKLGNVKKASGSGVRLENLWKSDPDVSDVFSV